MSTGPYTLYPFCEVLDTEYGKITVNKHDTAQTGFYRIKRQAINHEELIRIRILLDAHIKAKQSTPDERFDIIDVGAHIGTWGLFFSTMPQISTIWSYEPLRVYFDMISHTRALNCGAGNGRGYNIVPVLLAISDKPGYLRVPEFDWTVPTNFGGIELGGDRQQEFIGQERTGLGETVEVSTVDIEDQDVSHPVALLKVDVEGMEIKVLRGAQKVITRDRPILFVEFLKSDQEELRAFFEQNNYDVQKWHTDFLCTPR